MLYSKRLTLNKYSQPCRGLILFVLFYSLSQSAVAQTKIYYNKYGEESDTVYATSYSIYQYVDSGNPGGGFVYNYTMEGVLKSEIHYSNIYTKEGPMSMKVYYDNGQLKYTVAGSEKGYSGPLVSYYRSGVVKRKDIFENGKFVSGNCYTEEGKDTAHYDFQIMPEFPGGEAKMLKYIQKKFRYPEEARSKNIHGKVLTEFIVDESGNVQGAYIKTSVHPLLDKEALRIVNEMPVWKPGRQDNEPVQVMYRLPIDFRLN